MITLTTKAGEQAHDVADRAMMLAEFTGERVTYKVGATRWSVTPSGRRQAVAVPSLMLTVFWLVEAFIRGGR